VPALDEYRRKRNPAATTEPMSTGVAAMGTGNSFVVQEHHATALHWDFRLERDGVLVSWAVPKGVPTDPKVNRLAVHVEDHPLEYASYEGNISHGQYGADAVSIWDAGTYVVEKWSEREVKIVLAGRRVQGRFVLFQTGGKNWMMHRMDGPPRPDWLTLPGRVEPMLATNGSLPVARGWSYEMDWPGVRSHIRVEGGRIDVTSADGSAIGPSFPELRPMGEQLGATQALLDGVLVHFGPDGHLDADRVTDRIGASPARARPTGGLPRVRSTASGRALLASRQLPRAQGSARRTRDRRRVIADPTDLRGRWSAGAADQPRSAVARCHCETVGLALSRRRALNRLDQGAGPVTVRSALERSDGGIHPRSAQPSPSWPKGAKAGPA
jgi:bifunctional non-homologous end joining protein LigD